MKRITEHGLSNEQRERHRQVLQEIEAEKPEIIARERQRLRLQRLATAAREVLDAVDRGEPMSRLELNSLREAVEAAEHVL